MDELAMDSVQVDPNCPFCAIVSGREHASVMHRWDDCVAFSPLRPATLGHSLVVPISHIRTIWDLDSVTAQKLSIRVLEMAVVLRKVLDLADMNIIQSNGELATQTVPHLHVHLVPRYPHDAMGDIWPSGSRVEEAETRRVAAEVSKSFTD